MHTEEFVLIPRQMFANEQPQIAQVLHNKNVREKTKQISLLQSFSFSDKTRNFFA